jgi:hypothetical protein
MAKFAIAPAHCPTDLYAAGYDDNRFDTEQEARDAIASLRALGGEWAIEWIVVPLTDPADIIK